MKKIKLFKEIDFGTYLQRSNKPEFKGLQEYSYDEILNPNFNFNKVASEAVKANEVGLLTIPNLKTPNNDTKIDPTRGNNAVVEYMFEYTGDINLLSVSNSFFNYQGREYIVEVDDKIVKFTILTRYATTDFPDDVVKDILKEKNRIIEDLEKSVEGLNQQITLFNGYLHELAKQVLTQRQKEVVEKKKMLDRL